METMGTGLDLAKNVFEVFGVDARTGLTHSFTTTAANEHDLNQAENLLYGDEDFIFADAGYPGAKKREEAFRHPV